MCSSVSLSMLSNPDAQLHRLLRKRPRFVFLDAVNTLMDLTPDFPGFFLTMARSQGVECDPAFLKEALERSRQRVRERLAGRMDFTISQERERAFWRSIDSEIFREIGFGDRSPEIADNAFAEFESGRHFRLLDETIPALRRIRELGFPLGIVSNGTEGMERWMRACAFAPYMEFIIVSVDVGWEKA
ncbi:MAG: HAD family hydrolase, partial [Candidatus Sumerlaeota bacterium]|nr:HAD family hydrolase [Candidatus Sumerlaeota bacterium]